MYHGLIVNGFKDKPTTQQQEVMTTIGLDTDLSSIYDKLGSKKVAKLLKSSKELSKEVEDTKADIKELDSEFYNYYVAQAKGLGTYMVTHEAKAVYQYNATSIANRLNYKPTMEADKELVDAVDKLATLEALAISEKGDKEALADLIDKDAIGMENFMAFHYMFKETSQKEEFKDKPEKVMKGYIKEIFDGDISTKIIRADELKDYEAIGYEKVENVKLHKKDESSTKLILVKNSDNITKTYDKALLRLKDDNVLGTSIVEVKKIQEKSYASSELLARARNDMTRITNSRFRQLKMMDEGTYDPDKDDFNLLAISDSEGNVMSYNYVMPKAKKKELLDQDTKATAVLAGMFTDAYDLKSSKEFNREVFNLAKKDAIENGVNPEARIIKSDVGKNYIMLEADSKDKNIRDIWRILPKDFANIIKEEGYKGALPLRRDLLFTYIGSRKMSITDGWAGKTKPSTQHVLRHIESIWKEIVSIAKVNIIIKTPAVFAGNVISNLAVSVKFGISPLEVMRLQMDGVKYLTEYSKNSKKLEILKARRAAKLISKSSTTNTDKQIEVLEGMLANSPIADMVDAGLHQAIIEDTTTDDLKNKGKMGKFIDKKLDAAPSFVRTGTDYLFLTDKTTPFKLMAKGIQYSDFVARYAVKEAMIRQGPPPSQSSMTDKEWHDYVMNTVVDTFINYSVPDSKLVQYLNDMGLLMFTKYFIRIQRVIRHGARKHPVNFLLAILAQEAIMGIDDITDQSLLTKDYSNLAHSHYDVGMHALLPSGLELVT